MSTLLIVALLLLGIVLVSRAGHPARRGNIDRLTGPVEHREDLQAPRMRYSGAFRRRHRDAWRILCAFRAAHGAAHDLAQLTPQAGRAGGDVGFDNTLRELLTESPDKSPLMRERGPFVSQWAWELYVLEDWTHTLREMVLDILSDRQIPWERKKERLDRALKGYRRGTGTALSPAPLDLVLRRANVLMKPYFCRFRADFPRAAAGLYAGAWWQKAALEAMMGAGGGEAQDEAVSSADSLLSAALDDPPQRLLLAREVMPRFARLSPEAANILDNLDMLHSLACDVMAYPEWTVARKKAEVKRIIEAFSYAPGDETLARRFDLPHPDVEPGAYEGWMTALDGETSRIALEMLNETLPVVALKAGPALRARAADQVLKQCQPGRQPGELEGALVHAVRALAKKLKALPHLTDAGKECAPLRHAMVQGWLDKYGSLDDVEEFPMEAEPEAAAATPS